MKMEKMDLGTFEWRNKPEQLEVFDNAVEFTTEPGTDFWQRTHVDFSRANGHAFLTRLWDDFSLTIHVEYVYEFLFDQCGLFLYLDDDNWAKACVEYNDESFSQLGSVVTTNGYSDWATTLIPTAVGKMYFRISRRGSDFLFENSRNGDQFEQMRIFHVHGDLATAKVGLYACSPGDSSFKVRFNQILASPSAWR